MNAKATITIKEEDPSSWIYNNTQIKELNLQNIEWEINYKGNKINVSLKETLSEITKMPPKKQKEIQLMFLNIEKSQGNIEGYLKSLARYIYKNKEQ